MHLVNISLCFIALYSTYVHNVGDDAIRGGGYHIIRGLSALDRLLFAQLCCCFPLRPKC